MEPSQSQRHPEPSAPLVFSLDRRGPNDRRINSAHVVVGVLIALLAVGMAML